MQEQAYEECRAFVTRLEAEHRRLKEMLRRARVAIASCAQAASKGTSPQLAILLQQLREELRQHFSEEERGGCLDEAVARLPRLAADAERLEAEHRELLRRLDRLVDWASHREKLASDWSTFDAELESFYRLLHAHENSEKSLLQQGFGVSGDEV